MARAAAERGGVARAEACGSSRATRLSKANTCSANFGLRLFSKAMAGPLVPANFGLWSFHTHSRRNEVLMNFEGGVQGAGGPLI